MPSAPKWEAWEEAIVASFFPKRTKRRFVNWKKLLPQLNNRTRAAVLNHMRVIRLEGKVDGSLGPKQWSKKELRTLISLWQLEAPMTIMRKLRKRNWRSILMKARDLGLGTAIPQGHLSTSQMALRLGVDFSLVAKIAALSDIRRHSHYGACEPASKPNVARWAYWPIDEMEEACKKWLEYEKVGPLLTTVARFLRTTPAWIVGALAELGVTVKDPAVFRISPELKEQLKGYKRTCLSDSSPAIQSLP